LREIGNAGKEAYTQIGCVACELLLCVCDCGAPYQEELEEWFRTKKVVNYQAYCRPFWW
jgi:hypothetical protein